MDNKTKASLIVLFLGFFMLTSYSYPDFGRIVLGIVITFFIAAFTWSLIYLGLERNFPDKKDEQIED